MLGRRRPRSAETGAADGTSSRPAEVLGVYPGRSRNVRYVRLAEAGAGRCLSIPVSAEQGAAVTSARQRDRSGPTSMHELLVRLLDALGVQVSGVRVEELRGEDGKAAVLLSDGVEVATELTDALVLAAWAGAVVRVADRILDERGETLSARRVQSWGQPDSLAAAESPVPFELPQSYAALLRTLPAREMRPSFIHVDESDNRALMLLAAADTDLSLPVWMTAAQGKGVESAMKGAAAPRHRLACDVLAALGARIDRIAIMALRYGVYHVSMTLDDGTVASASTADALALALAAGARIFAAQELIDRSINVAIAFDKQAGLSESQQIYRMYYWAGELS